MTNSGLHNLNSVRFSGAIALWVCLLLCSALVCVARADVPVDFTLNIAPIIQAHCIDCHGPDEQESQFRMDRLANLLAGGNSGEPAVVPGKPDESFLLKLIRHKEPGQGNAAG